MSAARTPSPPPDAERPAREGDGRPLLTLLIWVLTLGSLVMLFFPLVEKLILLLEQRPGFS